MPMSLRASPFDQVRSSILSIDQEFFSQLSADEREKLETFAEHAKKYAHRLQWPMSQDRFLEVDQALALSGHFKYARVPLKSIDTVYYLFQDHEALVLAIQTLTSIAPPMGGSPQTSMVKH